MSVKGGVTKLTNRWRISLTTVPTMERRFEWMNESPHRPGRQAGRGESSVSTVSRSGDRSGPETTTGGDSHQSAVEKKVERMDSSYTNIVHTMRLRDGRRVDLQRVHDMYTRMRSSVS